MRYGKYYWRHHWEPSLDREANTDAPNPDGGREHLPPTQAQRSIPARHSSRPVSSPGDSHPFAPKAQGHPLPRHLRDRLEQTFDTDLSTVRLNQDEAANQALNARAFTLDDHIILRHATDQTNLPLLRHEIAHLLQAQQHGTQPGISTPEAASEKEATLMERGEYPPIPTSGAPVPAIQRQGSASGAAPADPMIQRESVRMVLMLHYQQQGGKGTFPLTPALQSDLQRLIPGITGDALALLWTPEPTGPQEALQRLIEAGYLPLLAAEPEPKPEAEPEAPTP